MPNINIPHKATKTAFDLDDENHLVAFLAEHRPGGGGRLGNSVYQMLVDNAGHQWPWAARHSWQSWRELYKKNENSFDHKIRKYQKKNSISAEGSPKRGRIVFTAQNDKLLVKFLAESTDAKRKGMKIYQNFVDTLGGEGHTAMSWRGRYIEKQTWFDNKIKQYRKAHVVDTDEDETQPEAQDHRSGDEGYKSSSKVAEDEVEGAKSTENIAMKGKRKRGEGSGNEQKRQKHDPASKRGGLGDERGKGSKVEVKGQVEVRGRNKKDNGEVVEGANAGDDDVEGGEGVVGNATIEEEQDEEEGGEMKEGGDPFTVGRRNGVEEQENVGAEEAFKGKDEDPTDEQGRVPLLLEDDPAVIQESSQPIEYIETNAEEPQILKSLPREHADSRPFTAPTTAVSDLQMMYPDIDTLPSPHLHPFPVMPVPTLDEEPSPLPGAYEVPQRAIRHSTTDTGQQSEEKIVPEEPMTDALPLSCEYVTEYLLQDFAPNSTVSPRSSPLLTTPRSPGDVASTTGAVGHQPQPVDSYPSRMNSGSPPPPSQRKRKRLVSSNASDYFESLPASPSLPPKHPATRTLPQMVEEPFHTALNRSKKSANANDGPKWPPLRRKPSGTQPTNALIHNLTDKKAVDAAPKTDREVQTETVYAFEAEIQKRRKILPQPLPIDHRSAPVGLPTKPGHDNGVPAPKPRQPINLQHTSNGHSPRPINKALFAHHGKVSTKPSQLEPISPISYDHHPFSLVDEDDFKDYRLELQKVDGATGGNIKSNDRATSIVDLTSSCSSTEQFDARKSDNKFGQANMQAKQPVAGPSVPRITALRYGKNAVKAPLPRTTNIGSNDDPFLDAPLYRQTSSIHLDVIKSNGKERSDASLQSRRHTIGGGDSLPMIDLRKQQDRRPQSTRQSSNPRSWTDRSSSRSSASSKSTRDAVLIHRLGTDRAIEVLSNTYGFKEEIVRNVWKVANSWEVTERVIRVMKENAEAAGVALLEEAVGGDDDEGYAYQGAGSPLRRITRPSNLSFTPADDDHKSDYSPPKTSRAGQFARLVKAGRRQEALKREWRRTSGVAFPLEFPASQETNFPQPQEESPTPNTSIEKRVVNKIPRHSWNEDDDMLLLGAASRDEKTLQEISKTFGVSHIKQRTVDLFSSFFLYILSTLELQILHQLTPSLLIDAYSSKFKMLETVFRVNDSRKARTRLKPGS